MFLIDLESYLTEETKKNKELDENVAKQIFDEFKEKLENEPKIEIDSFFFNVKGKKVKDFFLNMKQYSFPANETAININEEYTILVESTHCLKNTLKKKTEQLAKYYLFFSLFNQYLVEYEKYIGDVYAFLANIVGLAVKPGLCRLAYLGYCPTARMGQVDAGRRRDSAFCSRVRGLHSADESNAALDVVVCIQRWQQVCYSAVLSIDGLCRP